MKALEHVGNNERAKQHDFGLDLLGIYFTYETLLYKVKKIKKFNWSLYPSLVFAQAIAASFESTSIRLLKEDLNKPKVSPEEPKTAASPILEYIQDNIIKAMTKKETYWKNFTLSFTAAINKHLEKIAKIQIDAEQASKEDLLIKGLFTGEDYWQTHSFKTSLLFRAIDRRLRVTYSINKSNLAKLAELLTGIVIATPLAAVSTLLVNIDHVGRIIGGALAISAKQYFGLPFTEKIAAYSIPPILISILLYREIADFIFEFAPNLIHQGCLYPIFTGAAVSLHEVITTEHPEILSQLQNKIPLLPEEIKNDRTLWESIKNCYEQTKIYYEKYDKTFTDSTGLDRSGQEIISESLAIDFNSSKKILEGRRALFALCKKAGYWGEYIKNFLLISRASMMTLRNLIAKSIFTITKNLTKPLYHLTKQLQHGLFVTKDHNKTMPKKNESLNQLGN